MICVGADGPFASRLAPTMFRVEYHFWAGHKSPVGASLLAKGPDLATLMPDQFVVQFGS